MKKLKVAIIGAGQIADKMHIPAYKNMNDRCEVVAVTSRSLEEAKNLTEKHGIKYAYDDHLIMLQEIKPDVVSICVPNSFHFKMTMDALMQGAHVFCEKPPGLSGLEAQRMEEEARNANRLLTYGFQMRHLDEIRILKEKMLNGDLGKVYRAETNWLRRRGIPGWGNFTDKSIQGGGSLIDLGSHMLDLTCYLLDYPKIKYVAAHAYEHIGRKGGKGVFGYWSGEAFSVEDSFFGSVAFEDGTSLQIGASFALHQKEETRKELAIYGSHKSASLLPLVLFGADKEGELTEEKYQETTTNLYDKMLGNFLKAVAGEESVLITAAQGTYVQKLIEKLYESSEKGMPVMAEGEA